jgi:aspartate racemase
MRRLGLIGGMSWESTAVYYRLLNQGVAARLGGLHSAPLLIESFDFTPIAALQAAGDWNGAGRILAASARRLESAGAEGLALTTNTMHHVAQAVEEAVSIPLLHIVDAMGTAMRSAGIQRAGLLGTRYTMELPFWRDRLANRFGMELVVPDASDRGLVHRVIYDELCLGRINPDSRAAFAAIIERLGKVGAEAVVLGCTEIALLIGPGDSPLPAFDTTALHAAAAVDFIVSVGDSGWPAATDRQLMNASNERE